MELVLASGNEHKAEEFQVLFPRDLVTVKSAPQKVEVVEDGSTFFENALLKASQYHALVKKPVLSDDSGLIVDFLPGELGIHSARFGGDDLTGEQRCDLLLEKMKEVPESQRTAHFVCVLCLYFSEDEYFFFEGRMNGSIGYQKEGDGGFGYDPVFIPARLASGRSVATDSEWKHENSHRSVAVSHMVQYLKSCSKG